MIGIEPDVLEIVVFASGANAFLGVCDAGGQIRALRLAQEKSARTDSFRRW